MPVQRIKTCLGGQRLRSSRGFLVPGRKGRSPDAFASGQGPGAPGAEYPLDPPRVHSNRLPAKHLVNRDRQVPHPPAGGMMDRVGMVKVPVPDVAQDTASLPVGSSLAEAEVFMSCASHMPVAMPQPTLCGARARWPTRSRRVSATPPTPPSRGSAAWAAAGGRYASSADHRRRPGGTPGWSRAPPRRKPRAPVRQHAVPCQTTPPPPAPQAARCNGHARDPGNETCAPAAPPGPASCGRGVRRPAQQHYQTGSRLPLRCRHDAVEFAAAALIGQPGIHQHGQVRVARQQVGLLQPGERRGHMRRA